MSLTILMPIKTISASNAREHHFARSRRVKRERSAAYMISLRLEPAMMPCAITLTRISFGELDDDNLRGALKAVRDGIADRLGIDDRDPRVSWHYGQRREGRGRFAVELTVTPA